MREILYCLFSLIIYLSNARCCSIGIYDLETMQVYFYVVSSVSSELDSCYWILGLWNLQKLCLDHDMVF